MISTNYILSSVAIFLLMDAMCHANPPSGFELQKQYLADPTAQRQVHDKRMSLALVQETRERQQIRSVPGGQEALERVQELELARKERERELLRPLEAVKREYADVLREKLQADAVYQTRKAAVLSAEEQLKNDNELSMLLAKHQKRIAGNENAHVLSRDEVLSAISESDDAPRLRKVLQSNYAASQEVWRLRGEAGNRQREIEQTDPNLLKIKRQEASLLRELETDVLAHDEQLQRLADEIAVANREVEDLKVEATQQQTGDDN